MSRQVMADENDEKRVVEVDPESRLERNEYPWIVPIGIVYDLPDLSIVERVLLGKIWMYSHRKRAGRCTASNDRLAYELGCDERTVSRAIARLIKRGLIIRAKNRGRRALKLAITGKLVGGRVIKARFKELIEGQVFDRVQMILAGKGHVATPHRVNNEAFPLRQFVLCGACGSPLTASFSRGGSGGRYPYYRCRNKACLAVHVKRDGLEEAFRQYLSRNVTEVTAPRLRLFRDRVIDLWKGRHTAALAEQAAQRKRLEDLKAQQSRLLDLMCKGKIADEVYQDKAAELSAEIAITRVQAHDSELDELDIEGVLNCAEYMFRNTVLILDKLDLDNRQRFQRVLFPSGLAYSMAEGFGTGASSPIINVIQQKQDVYFRLARPRRVELRFQG